MKVYYSRSVANRRLKNFEDIFSRYDTITVSELSTCGGKNLIFYWTFRHRNIDKVLVFMLSTSPARCNKKASDTGATNRSSTVYHSSPMRIVYRTLEGTSVTE